MKNAHGEYLKKSYMEVEGNQRTRDTSKYPQTVLKKNSIFLGEGGWKREGVKI